MAIQPNYLARGGDPYAGQAAINEDAMASIGTALFGNPQVAGQRALRTAQAEQIGLENERARRGLEYGDRFGADMAGVFTVKNPDGSTRPATFAEAAPRLGDLFKSAYWANNGDPTRTANWLRAFTAMTGNEDLTRAGYAASGLALGPDFAATTGRADQVQARNAASDKDRATAVAGIGAQAQRDVADRRERGETDRQRARLQWDEANPSSDRVRADVIQTFVNDPLLGPDQRTERQELVVAPGVQTARERAAGQAQAAQARGDASVRVAEIRGLSAENVARLVQEGKVTAADIAAHARVKAAETTAGATVTAADKAAAARVEAAMIGADADRDVAAARAGASKPNITIPSAVSKGWDTEIEALVGESDFSVNDEAKLWLKQRAGEIYQQPGPGQRNSTAAMRQAWEDFKAADPANTRGSLGRMLFSPRFGAPSAPAGTAPLVPGQPAAPAAPAAGAAPPRPPNVPPGSAYSPSRNMWRAPDGRMFTKDGVPAA
jgi:hypothetical protein